LNAFDVLSTVRYNSNFDKTLYSCVGLSTRTKGQLPARVKHCNDNNNFSRCFCQPSAKLIFQLYGCVRVYYFEARMQKINQPGFSLAVFFIEIYYIPV